MRLGLPGLLILCAWHVPVPTGASYGLVSSLISPGNWGVESSIRPPRIATTYGCGYESLQTTKAMCYMRFHCGKALCPSFARKGDSLFLLQFPVCCLHPVIRSTPKYESTCRALNKYSVDDARCDPAAHEVVKVDVVKRPPRPTTTPRPPRPTANISWCPRYIRSSSYLSKWPQCCFHPTIYRRYKKQCAWMRIYKRRKREDTESDVMRRWVAEDDGVQDGYKEDMQEAIAAGETDIPEMRDAKIEVTCCGSGETKSCRGAECFYVCDDPASDTAVDTLDITSSDDTCNPEIIGEDNTGRRKKRGYSAATMASWKINWCPRYVTKNRGKWIKWYKICCFHPAVRRHPVPGIRNGAEGGVADWCHGKSKIFAAWTG